MSKITIGHRSFELPVLVASISSFETQLEPPDALRLQIAMGEPISLVSAYDVAQREAELAPLCEQYRQTGVMLMDSGGYESSRIRKYAHSASVDWNFEHYKRIASRKLYDFIFSMTIFSKLGRVASILSVV